MTSPNKRKEMDIMKLAMSSFQIHIPDEACMNDFWVKFHGPADTPFQGGIWKIHVILPAEYPYKSPSIGFMNRIFHPNIEERSGSVCLNVINQTWSPMFDLLNIMEVFLPQLLRYPNPSDPLNGHAATLLMENEEKYNAKVREYVQKYASVDFSVDDEEDANQPNSRPDDRKVSADSGAPSHGMNGHAHGNGNGHAVASNGNGESGAQPVHPRSDMDVEGGGDDDDDGNASDVSDMSDL